MNFLKFFVFFMLLNFCLAGKFRCCNFFDLTCCCNENTLECCTRSFGFCGKKRLFCLHELAFNRKILNNLVLVDCKGCRFGWAC